MKPALAVLAIVTGCSTYQAKPKPAPALPTSPSQSQADPCREPRTQRDEIERQQPHDDDWYNRLSRAQTRLSACQVKEIDDRRAESERRRAELARLQTGADLLRADAAVKAEQTDDAHYQESSKAPAFRRLAMSVLLCDASSSRKAALTEIAKQKKYSSLGGVENKAALYNLQLRVRTSDERIAEANKRLSAAHASPMSCTDKAVHAVWSCFVPGVPHMLEHLEADDCSDPDNHVRLIREVVATLPDHEEEYQQ
jgi:hypothetical protein